MLFAVFDQLRSEPTHAVITLLGFVLAIVAAITVHEFSHALSANLLGDDTAKSKGRLTLNPLAHLDPAGTVMIVVVGFGWGKPTPVNPARFGNRMRSGMAMVSFAGPISNVIVASLAAIPVKIGLLSPGIVGFSLFQGEPGEMWAYFLGSLIFINILLAAFNLIPVAPLDGFKVVQGLPAPRPGGAVEPTRTMGTADLVPPHPIGLHPTYGQPDRTHNAALGKRPRNDHHWWTDLGLIWFNL